MATAATVYRDYVTDGVPSSGANKPKKREIRALLTGYEQIITAFTSNGGLVYSNKAAMDADLANDANSMAWVIGDPIAANNGVYGKVGASGTGSWTRRSDLPFSFIIASDAGAGTPNAIQATTSIPVSESALIWMNIADTNGPGPVTVQFNGSGTVYTIKNNSGTDIATGGLPSGMIILGIISGTTFRLISDQVSAAIIAQTQAILDQFRTIYLGAFAVAPTTDLEGNPLQVGAQYFNTVSNTTFTWDGSAWTVNSLDTSIAVPPNLTGSVEAPPIVKANGYRWSIFAFNGGETERAKATSIADYREVFETALATGEKVVASHWEYPVRSYNEATRVISFTGDVPIDIEWEGGATIIPGAELSGLTAGFFSLRASSFPSDTSKVPLRWDGGIWDTSELTSAPGFGLTLLDIYQYTNAVITRGVFKCAPGTPSGADMGFGKCDTAISTHNCYGETIAYNDFGAFYDACIYISGKNGGETLGDYGLFSNALFNRMRRAQNAVVFKRDHIGIRIIGNDAYQCGNGFLASPASPFTNNQGKRVIITNNRVIETQGRPILVIGGKKNIIANNDISDWGKWFSDKTTFTTVANSNRCAAIDLRGARLSQVTNNVIDQDLYAGGDATAGGTLLNREPVGIQVRDTEEGVGSTDNDIVGNRIYHAHRPIIEFGANTNRNRFQDNPETAGVAGTILPTLVQGANSQFIGALLEGSVIADIPSIADGSGYDLAVTVTGVAIGDWVDSVSFSRDIAGLTYSANVTAENTVEIRLQNETGVTVDLANTIFKVRVRRA